MKKRLNYGKILWDSFKIMNKLLKIKNGDF